MNIKRPTLAAGLAVLAVSGLGGGAAIAANDGETRTAADTPRAIKGTVSRAAQPGAATARIVAKDPRRANGAVIAAGSAGDVEGQVERAPAPGREARPAPTP